MKYALITAFVLQDICGILCFTSLFRLLWMFPERPRRFRAAAFAAAALISAAAAALTVSRIPAVMYTGVFDEASDEYGIYLIAVELQSFVSVLLQLTAPHVLLRTKRRLFTLLVELSVYMAAEAYFSVAATLLRLDVHQPSKLFAEAVYCSLVFLLLFFFFRAGLKKNAPLPIRHALDSFPRWVFPTVMLFSLTIYCRSALFDGGIDAPSAKRIYDVLWMLSCLGVGVSGVSFLYRFFMLSYRQTQILKSLDDTRDQYERAVKSDEALREFRHDYKNHMTVVTALLNSGRTQEASEYLRRVKVASGTVGRLFSTGNFIADAILNNKNAIAEEFAVHLGFSGVIPASGVENSDLCTVFANLLDNAIEGAKRFSGSRYVNVEASVRNGFLTLTFENPVSGPVEIKNNRVRTTKADGRNHGIGLRNVERTAEKYGGRMLLSCDGAVFRAEVMLKLDHTEKGDRS